MAKESCETQWGVILANLGTPERPDASAVRDFLKSFLSDQRVVELPKAIWLPILYGIILPFRSPKVAKAYKSIWFDGGSPLKVYTEQQVEGVQKLLVDKCDHAPLVDYAMTYGEKSIESTLAKLRSQGANKFLILPLYPQYSATTTAAIYDQVADIQKSTRDVYDIYIHKNYYYRDDYIEALANSVNEQWQSSPKAEKLLFSFHGIPKRCVDLGDPYKNQCLETAKMVAEKLQLSDNEWFVSFQSRLGKAEWLKPYTDMQLEEWAESGVKSVDVICPAFSVDCLETIEEIDEENRELFLSKGGENYQMIPCLNARPDHLKVISNIVEEYIDN